VSVTPEAGSAPLTVNLSLTGQITSGVRLRSGTVTRSLDAFGLLWQAGQPQSWVPSPTSPFMPVTNPNYTAHRTELTAYDRGTGELVYRTAVARAGSTNTLHRQARLFAHGAFLYVLTEGYGSSSPYLSGDEVRSPMLQRVDPDTGAVVASLDVPAWEMFALDGDTLHVAQSLGYGTSALGEVDLPTMTVVGSSVVNYGVYGLAHDGSSLLIGKSSTVVTGSGTTTLATPTNINYRLYAGDGYGYFWTVSGDGARQYDIATGTLQTTVAVPAGHSSSFHYSGGGAGKIWLHGSDGALFYIDIATATASATVASGVSGYLIASSSGSTWLSQNAGVTERYDTGTKWTGWTNGDTYRWTASNFSPPTLIEAFTTGASGTYEFTSAGQYVLQGAAISASQIVWAVDGGFIEVTEPPPVTAVIAADPLSGYPALDVRFDGTGSTSSGDPITSYEWDFGDGETATGAVVNHTYGTPGARTVTLTVTTASGTDTDSVVVNAIAAEVQTNHVPTADLLDTLRWSHRAYTRVILRTPDCTDYVLPVVGGSITIDRNAKTFRSADIDIAIDALGTDERTGIEKLTVQSGEVLIYAGTIFEDNRTEEVLVGRLRVDSLERTDSAVAKVTAYDYALMLDEHPANPATGALIPKGTDWRVAVRRLVEETFTWKPCGMDTMLVIDPDVPAWALEDQAWDNANRLTAIAEWAEAQNCWFYNLPDGRFYLTPANEDTEPVWTVNTGEGGVLVRATQRFAREEQYNAVSISFDLPGEEYESVRAYAVDDDPKSTTRWGGPFGKRVLTLSGIPAKNIAEAQAIARRKLEENRGATRALSLTTVRNPALIPGQVIEVVHPLIGTERHVIERVTHQFSSGTSDIDCKLRRL
jgi:PKD domain